MTSESSKVCTTAASGLTGPTALLMAIHSSSSLFDSFATYLLCQGLARGWSNLAIFCMAVFTPVAFFAIRLKVVMNIALFPLVGFLTVRVYRALQASDLYNFRLQYVVTNRNLQDARAFLFPCFFMLVFATLSMPLYYLGDIVYLIGRNVLGTSLGLLILASLL